MKEEGEKRWRGSDGGKRREGKEGKQKVKEERREGNMKRGCAVTSEERRWNRQKRMLVSMY